jgi:hypothetical protein
MRRRLAFASAFVFALSTRLATAWERPHHHVVFFLGVSEVAFSPPLDGLAFHGDGVARSGGQPATFQASGDELRVSRPTVRMTQVILGAELDSFYLVFGGGSASASVGGEPGPSHDGLDRSRVLLSRGFIESGGQLWFGALRLKAGMLVGVQTIALEAPAYNATSCRSALADDCGATARLDRAMFGPRLGSDVILGAPLALTLGGFIGANVLPPRAFEVGLTATVDFHLVL